MNKGLRLSLIFFTITIAQVSMARQVEKNIQTPAPAPNQVSTPNLEGMWEGALQVGGMKFRLALKVTKSADGAFEAKFDSLDQGATNLLVDIISLKESAVHFEMKRHGVSFDGSIDRENSVINGQFNQGGASFPLTFKRVAKLTTLTRPQEPKAPYPYDEEEVSYENKRDNVKLAGTLTLPRSKSSFPAVILITGSGAQNRNEEMLGHKPFLVLADYLTRQGIAVLRVDDRGVGGSTGSVPNSTSENFGFDVMAGIEFLKGHQGVNPKQIGLIGHSEGGLIAPMVAAQSNDVSFIVMLAGPGLPGEDILHMQNELILKAMGASPETLAKNRASQEAIFNILKQEKDTAMLEKKLREEFDKQIASTSESEKSRATKTTEAEIKQALTPWFRYFLTYDPRPALKKVKCPVLALNGEKDMQVPPIENQREIEASLKAAGNKNVTITLIPGLNHLFQTCESGAPSEYGKIEETFSPIALKTVGDWILNQTANK